MKTGKILSALTALMFVVSPAYCEDDDSTPYMPYLEQPKQENPAPKSPTQNKKTPAKKPTNNKKSTPKKSTPKKTPTKPSSLQKGIELMRQERYEQAKPYLLKAIQENKNDPNAWYWYGVYHEKTGGFYQAQYFYSKAITIDPAFDPLSRVVYYPEDSEKTPLWDPKRPARVYPVETSSKGLTTVPPNAKDRRNFPSAQNDPEIPRVPVYTPPEPGAIPIDGDSWAPGIYVPPSRSEIQTEGEQEPIYMPPKPQAIIADNKQSVEIPMYKNADENFYDDSERDKIIRVNLPVYNPPVPSNQNSEQPKQSITQTPQKNTDSRKQLTIPQSRVVKQSDKKSTPPKKTQPAKKQTQTQTSTPKTKTQNQPKKSAPVQPAKIKTVSKDVKPSEPSKPQQTQKKPVKPEVIVREERPTRTQYEYLPPVGQFSPDPGTISENPLPPVGQGNQN